MQLELHIHCASASELAGVLTTLAGATHGAKPNIPEHLRDQPEDEAPPTATKRGRGKKAQQEQAPAIPTQDPVTGEPIPPASEPLPQPTPGGTDAPPAESIPPNQEAASGDVFASGGQPEATAGDPGVVDLPALKTAMADLLKVKPAAFAMKCLEDATGCKSLSSGSPSVIEKSKDDPAIMQRALDALIAGKTAA